MSLRHKELCGRYAPTLDLGESTAEEYHKVRLAHVVASAEDDLRRIREAEHDAFVALRAEYKDWVWEVKYQHRLAQNAFRKEFEENCAVARDTDVVAVEREARLLLYREWKGEYEATLQLEDHRRGDAIRGQRRAIQEAQAQADAEEAAYDAVLAFHDEADVLLRVERRGRATIAAEETAAWGRLSKYASATLRLKALPDDETSARRRITRARDDAVSAKLQWANRVVSLRQEETWHRAKLLQYDEPRHLDHLLERARRDREFCEWQAKTRGRRAVVVKSGGSDTRWSGEGNLEPRLEDALAKEAATPTPKNNGFPTRLRGVTAAATAIAAPDAAAA